MRTGVAIVAALVLVAGADGASGSLPGRNGLLAFAAPEPIQQLFSIRLDGSDEQRVTRDFADPFFGVYSPDGSHVAFLAFGAAPTGGGTALVVATSDGSAERALDDWALTGADPAWSPDGSYVAFSHGVQQGTQLTSEVWITRVDGSDKHRIGAGGAPSWSPDGRSIVAADGHDVAVYDVATGARRVLATVAADTWLPHWSPDGSEVTYTEIDDKDQATASIRAVSATGTDDRRLTSGFSATWSPDGSHLAVVKRFYGAGPLEITDRNGALVTRFEEASGYDPDWSPDGQWIAFTAGSDPNRLMVGRADGSARRTVIDERAYDYLRDPDWSPDGKHILYVRSRTQPRPNQIHTLAPAGGPPQHLVTDLDAQQPSWSPDGEELAYTVSDGPWHAVAASTEDGGVPRTVTSGPDDSEPSWSPDGSRIVFVRSKRIAVTSAVGEHVRLLRRGNSPAWSPNGRLIAFIVNGELWTMKPDGTGARKILSAKRAGSLLDRPTWTPDGRSIAIFVGAILLVRPDGSNLQRVDISAALDGSPFDHLTAFDWSPDGTLLALVLQHERGRIVLFSPTTGSADVVAGNVPAAGLSWQPRCTLSGDGQPNTLRGTNGPDVICGFAGPDNISGGPGTDRIFGEAGNDRIQARDGAFDVVGCGPGRDTVVADRLDMVGVDCEIVRRR